MAALVALTRPRRVASGGLGMIHLLLAFAYSRPALSQAAPAPGNRVSVVAYVNALGPVWLVAFGVTGALLLVALLIWHTGLRWAHIAGVLVATIYSCAIWSGFILSDPRPTIISAVLSVTLVVWHISMSDLYSSPIQTRRRHAA